MKSSDAYWFAPLWRRIAVTAACVIWMALEWLNRDPIWGTLTAGLVAYCIWSFFISFKAPEPRPQDQDEGNPPASP